MKVHDPETFWSRVPDRGEGCWEWGGARNREGYGRYSKRLAHRVAYELAIGPIPEGMAIDHLCRNKSCVRPDHMEPVTWAENTRRWAMTVTHCVNGHEFTPENTGRRSDKPARLCLTCVRERSRAAYRRRKAAA